jgi:hypothetical protein
MYFSIKKLFLEEVDVSSIDFISPTLGPSNKFGANNENPLSQ